MLVAEVATLFTRINVREMTQMSCAGKSRPVVQREPERLDFHMLLAEFTFRLDELEESQTLCTGVMNCQPLGVGYLSRFQFDLQTRPPA